MLKLECAVEQGAEKGSTVSERKVYRRGEIRHDQPTPAQPSRVMREITSRTNLHLKFPANMVCRMPQIRGSQQIPDVVLLQDSLFLSFLSQMWVVAHMGLQLGFLKGETVLAEMFMSRPSLTLQSAWQASSGAARPCLRA